jgi:choline dehydrogenase
VKYNPLSPELPEELKMRASEIIDDDSVEYSEAVQANQRKLKIELKSRYDFIVCGSGSSGSVVARRLAENANVSVLLLEAGGSDRVPAVIEAAQWPLNIGSDRDWGFVAQPNPHVNGRSIPLSMGKVLGGGSSINVMIWSRGHKRDWDFFAEETGDLAWSYKSILKIYKTIEDWRGAPDPDHRGTGGLVFVQPAPNPHPIAPALLRGARSVGIPTFDSPNGNMMESDGGSSIADVRLRHGKRLSVFRTYVYPYMDRPNLTVLTDALVTRVTFEGKRASGVEIFYEGKVLRIGADSEVVLSLGAIHTPKVLMQSGIGDEAELRRVGIPLVQHLPGVGRNFQDHVGAASCLWEYPGNLEPCNNGCEATIFWKSDPSLSSPDLQPFQGEFPVVSAEISKQDPPTKSWCLFAGLVQPKSRGRIRLTGPGFLDPVEIHANTLEHPDDLRALVRAVELCREIGNSVPLRPHVKREVMPGDLKGAALEGFIRDAAVTYWHQTCTAKMGRDSMSAVDGQLKVYGVESLRVADGSVMPRVTTGNTMAPCVIIGERAGEMLRSEHKL